MGRITTPSSHLAEQVLQERFARRSARRDRAALASRSAWGAGVVSGDSGSAKISPRSSAASSRPSPIPNGPANAITSEASVPRRLGAGSQSIAERRALGCRSRRSCGPSEIAGAMASLHSRIRDRERGDTRFAIASGAEGATALTVVSPSKEGMLGFRRPLARCSVQICLSSTTT
jgi:hypothetical protein